MKKLNVLLIALVGAATFSLTSCKDECKDVTCDNGGTCTEGVCECPATYFGDNCEFNCVNGTFTSSCECDSGYEGDACTVESREDMIGAYSATDACSTTGSDTYDVQINESSTSIEGILISNFWGVFSNSVTATVEGNTITIPSQEPDNDDWFVSGTGTYNESSGTITMTYSVTDPGSGVDNCNGTWTKK